MTATSEAPFDRPKGARIGVTALNILLPGLGLVRLGHWRPGLAIGAAYVSLLWLMGALAIATPVGAFAMAALIVAWFWLVGLTLLLLSGILTWRRSRRDFDRHWWSRWYVILLWAVGGALLGWFASLFVHLSYKPFYIASESMIPTFIKNEKIMADMRWRKAEVGKIVMVRDPTNVVRIYRVAAIGGQTFEMRGGVPIIDGRPAVQKLVGEMPAPVDWSESPTGKILAEHLPGEIGIHRILLTSEVAPRNVAPIRLPTGSIYLLGDDRDLAADSRVSPAMGGIGVTSASAVLGRPLYITWSEDRSRIGQRADH